MYKKLTIAASKEEIQAEVNELITRFGDGSYDQDDITHAVRLLHRTNTTITEESENLVLKEAVDRVIH